MAFERGIDRRVAGRQERRRSIRTQVLAVATMACPVCDAPVVPDGAVSPSDALGCGFCDHAATVREFLSLAAPPRPTRVEVRVVPRAR